MLIKEVLIQISDGLCQRMEGCGHERFPAALPDSAARFWALASTKTT